VSEANRIGRERPRLMRFPLVTASYAGHQESQVPIRDNLPHGSNRGTILVHSRILRQFLSAGPLGFIKFIGEMVSHVDLIDVTTLQ
jgi:hypothetical protein